MYVPQKLLIHSTDCSQILHTNTFYQPKKRRGGEAGNKNKNKLQNIVIYKKSFISIVYTNWGSTRKNRYIS